MTNVLLDQDAALAWVGAHEWKKGQSYVRDLTGLSVRPQEKQTVLRGVAYGQESYQVRASLEGGEVASARCTCYVGGSGHCKHVAALLARATKEPGAFAVLAPLEEVLEGLSVPELHRLISRMLDREPGLEALVYAMRPQNAQSGSAREQLEAAFALLRRDYNPEWDHEGEGPDTEAIELILEEGSALLENLEALNETWAAELLDTYLTVLEEVDLTEEEDEGYGWGLEHLQTQALHAVQTLIRSGKLDEQTRAEALEAVQAEIASGRTQLDAPDFPEFVAALDPAERENLLELLRDLLRSARTDYERQRYAHVLHTLQAGQLDDAQSETLLRAMGDVGKLVDFLLARGRQEEAARAVREANFQTHFEDLEPVFAEHDELPLLEEVARQKLSFHGVRGWLFRRLASTGRRAQAHALAREEVDRGPSEFWLKALKEVSAHWEKERAELVGRLWPQRQHTGVLLSLLLRERLAEDALRLANERSLPPGSLLAVAEQLDATRAVPLILKAAQLHIDERSRGAYAQAAGVLKRLISLVGLEETRRHAAEIMARQPRLPALRDELRQAGLL